MEKFLVTGGNTLQGETIVSGSKNVALKALVAACLTEETMVINNVPLISDFFVMADIIKELGGSVELSDHTITITMKQFAKDTISLEKAANIRTSVMFISALLGRVGSAIIPNPGGCRIGARPIDRTIDGLKKMGVEIDYISDDGYFHAKAKGGLKATNYRFEKNTHTGTETLILAAVLAKGTTVLENAAAEPEVDELIELLNKMGASITRTDARTIKIVGVEKLHGTTFTISPDRNEIITLAIAAVMTKGDIFVKDATKKSIEEFIKEFDKAGGGYEEKENGMRFFYKGELKPTDVTTSMHPGFMTDWQAPWAVLMTQANGVSTVHETVYESRFGYVSQLKKLGARIELFNPEVKNPKDVYNFNLTDVKEDQYHAAKIIGPAKLHNGVVTITDLRAGATLVLGAMAAKGESVIYGLEHLDRGYEQFEKRLTNLGAKIKRVSE
jgi:UDP-N-acetylglucosamine 1-carboxyvinyltransferase